MADWLDAYRASVGWGDEIIAAYIPQHDLACCFVNHDGEHFYEVPGTLKDLPKAFRDAAIVIEATSCRVGVLFTDEDATAAEVEEALVTLADAGIGCGFIEPKPRVHQYALLNRYTEGGLLKEALKVIDQEGGDA
jgi:hypothetical protein